MNAVESLGCHVDRGARSVDRADHDRLGRDHVDVAELSPVRASGMKREIRMSGLQIDVLVLKRDREGPDPGAKDAEAAALDLRLVERARSVRSERPCDFFDALAEHLEMIKISVSHRALEKRGGSRPGFTLCLTPAPCGLRTVTGASRPRCSQDPGIRTARSRRREFQAR